MKAFLALLGPLLLCNSANAAIYSVPNVADVVNEPTFTWPTIDANSEDELLSIQQLSIKKFVELVPLLLDSHDMTRIMETLLGDQPSSVAVQAIVLRVMNYKHSSSDDSVYPPHMVLSKQKESFRKWFIDETQSVLPGFMQAGMYDNCWVFKDVEEKPQAIEKAISVLEKAGPEQVQATIQVIAAFKCISQTVGLDDMFPKYVASLWKNVYDDADMSDYIHELRDREGSYVAHYLFPQGEHEHGNKFQETVEQLVATFCWDIASGNVKNMFGHWQGTSIPTLVWDHQLTILRLMHSALANSRNAVAIRIFVVSLLTAVGFSDAQGVKQIVNHFMQLSATYIFRDIHTTVVDYAKSRLEAQIGEVSSYKSILKEANEQLGDTLLAAALGDKYAGQTRLEEAKFSIGISSTINPKLEAENVAELIRLAADSGSLSVDDVKLAIHLVLECKDPSDVRLRNAVLLLQAVTFRPELDPAYVKRVVDQLGWQQSEDITPLVMRLRADIDRSIDLADGKGETALSEAIKIRKPDILLLLLEDYGADPDAYSVAQIQAGDKMTTALIAAATELSECVQILVDHKVDVDQADGDGNTPLMHAAIYNRVTTVEILLNAGANVKKQNKDGITALINACMYGRREIVLRLLAAGADVNHLSSHKSKASAITGPSFYNHPDVVSDLLQHIEKNDLECINCDIALAFAALHGNGANIQKLLNMGVDINADCTERSFEFLMRDADSSDMTLISPICMAAKSGKIEIVQLLIANGAIVNEIAIDLARNNNHADVVDELTSALGNRMVPASALGQSGDM